jgi:hypothetical protein
MIQFHASIEEILAYVDSTRTKLTLDTVLLYESPYEVKQIQHDEAFDEKLLDSIRQDASLVLLESVDVATTSSRQAFHERNPGAVFIEIGNETSDGLYQSALSFMSDNEQELKLAKKIAARLKRITKAGPVAVNPKTGDECVVKTYRYTEGAKEKYESGIIIRPVAGGCILKLL